ncbi:MAG: hypothetical protein KAI24_14035 [Planctomycetes bacterium]|nr:hypothetical protein [Planctomycetota bacterium]
MFRPGPHASTLALILAAAAGPGARSQPPLRATTIPAVADAAATETGGFLLAIPGVDNDFVLFADGQWCLRPNGQAHWSCYAQRAGAVDRDLFVELTFAGEVTPGTANHPPAGAPVATLDPTAYAPSGPVDPSTWTYYTQVTGTITGLRAFAGLRVDVTSSIPAQVGVGASNKNVLAGLAADLDLSVTQPPVAAAFAPTGSAELRANFVDEVELCATHVDGDLGFGGTADRVALQLPGIGDDFLFLPEGAFVEHADGTATMTGTVLRQSDYQNAFDLQLTLDQRVDPGDANHPPAGAPVQLLASGSYAAQGGPIDPDSWRYYEQATATLTGSRANAGAVVALALSGTFQVGLGAGHGNGFFGVAGAFTASVQQQPNSGALAPTGTAELRANVATTCILPAPVVLGGDGQVVANVTDTVLTYTGTDLGFVQQAAIGQLIVGTDERRWLDGFVRIVDHGTVELSIPQGMPPGVHPLAMLNRTRVGNQLTIDVQEPSVATLQTAPDRLAGEPQHWLVHRGQAGAELVAVLCLSFSNQPSSAPGIVDLQIGNAFTELFVLGDQLLDPTTNLTMFASPTLPTILQGSAIHQQAALVGLALFPMTPTNVVTTTY